ncbi:hypothetical protein ZHAS_00000589 [Anopheles sinensis]|uniref:Uncharacterized protein n=1 Tax=Anopheles sinensis TaxID=74873 RepID=A0A084VA86_ANOSI|nr:hypothetical protein ZHAS_00000589 [Anopheles sinensis]
MVTAGHDGTAPPYLAFPGALNSTSENICSGDGGPSSGGLSDSSKALDPGMQNEPGMHFPPRCTVGTVPFPGKPTGAR